MSTRWCGAAAFLLLWIASGCSTAKKSAAADPAPGMPSPTTAPASVDLFAPRLQQIPIDGDASDWKGEGLRIDVLTTAATGPRNIDAGDAWLRLGWNERGLLVLVYGKDASAADSGAGLWKGSSVDLLLATNDVSRDMVHVSLTPVMEAGQAKLRKHFRDARQGKLLRQTPLAADVQVQRDADNAYVIEALLPWDQLGLSPSDGMAVNFQVYVNSVDGEGKRSRLIWYPVDGANYNTQRMHTVRLADRASEAITAAARGSFERFRRVRAEVVTLSEHAGKSVELKDGSTSLGTAPLMAVGRLSTAIVTGPLPPVGGKFTDLAVYVDGRRIAKVETEDLDRARRNAYEATPFVFSSFVFTGNTFPAAEFENPSLVEDVVGTYQITTTYYDADFKPVTRPTLSGRYGAIVDAVSERGLKMRRYYTLFRHDKPLPRDGLVTGGPIGWPAEFGVDPKVIAEQSATIAEGMARALRLSLNRNHDTATILAGLSELQPGIGSVPRRLGVWDRNAAWWYELRKSIGDVKPYQYAVNMPDGQAPAGGKWPLLIFLHGMGERGDDLKRVAVNGPLKEIAMGRALPFIVVAPQCPGNEWWGPQKLNEMLDDVLAKYPEADPDRVYLTGLSMGGFGTWAWSVYNPERFAAIAPICGGGDPLDVERIKDMPTWIFHGAKDSAVRIEESYRMVEALRKTSGRVRFTLYPNAGHDSWTDTYGNPAFYEWLLQQRRGKPAEPRATAPGTQPTYIED